MVTSVRLKVAVHKSEYRIAMANIWTLAAEAQVCAWIGHHLAGIDSIVDHLDAIPGPGGVSAGLEMGGR